MDMQKPNTKLSRNKLTKTEEMQKIVEIQLEVQRKSISRKCQDMQRVISKKCRKIEDVEKYRVIQKIVENTKYR